jgi:hypothetical protein
MGYLVTMSTPRFTHDCKKCNFLAHYNGHDLYFCGTGRMLNATVIARFSDSGPDYKSGLVLADVDPELAEAKRLAIERGLLNK